MPQSIQNSAFIFDPGRSSVLDVMGPTIEFVVPPKPDEPCILHGVIPPGAVIPIHSHPDPETFITLSGEIEGLAISRQNSSWVKLAAGSVLHVPSNVRHAFRNLSAEPSTGIVATTARLGEFFAEIGRSVEPGTPVDPPAEETIRRFLDTAARYGHWTGTPQDNAAVGIDLPS